MNLSQLEAFPRYYSAIEREGKLSIPDGDFHLAAPIASWLEIVREIVRFHNKIRPSQEPQVINGAGKITYYLLNISY